MDYADARKRMVDGQLRPNRVTDPRVLDAMRDLPREEFLPAAVRARAYSDEDVPLPGGRTMVEPMVIARLAQTAAVRPGDRALVVCAGTGYGAAVLARCGARVIAIETDTALAAIAGRALAATLPAGAGRIDSPRAAAW
jgi:protein-L-isoaspartate(D-aspartate) O-methyltransferase